MSPASRGQNEIQIQVEILLETCVNTLLFALELLEGIQTKEGSSLVCQGNGLNHENTGQLLYQKYGQNVGELEQKVAFRETAKELEACCY